MPTWACLLGFYARSQLQLLKRPIVCIWLPRADRGIVGDGSVSHTVPCSRYKSERLSAFPSLATPSRSCFIFFLSFLCCSSMVKSEPVDDVPQEPVAAPPAKRGRGRPRKDGTVGGQGQATAIGIAGIVAGRVKGSSRSCSKKTGVASGGTSRGKILLQIGRGVV